MGAAAVEALDTITDGGTVEPVISVPITIVTKENVDDFRADVPVTPAVPSAGGSDPPRIPRDPAARHRQELRLGRGAARRRSRPLARRMPRPRRRQRRRQVDADQGASPGTYIPDAGTIEIDGEPVGFAGPADARAAGIEMVFQDLSLCDHVDVVGNLFLGREPTRGPFLDRRRMLADGRAHARRARDPHPAPDRQGREAVRRPAPGHRHRPRRRLRAHAS